MQKLADAGRAYRVRMPSDVNDPSSPKVYILWEKSFNLKLSGDEFYSTNALLLIKKIMLCSRLYCQKVSD